MPILFIQKVGLHSTLWNKRTELLKNVINKDLDALEQTCLANNAKYKDWEYDEAKMKLTKNQDALYMHCLPADIVVFHAKKVK